jgi:methionine-rich copper-binding protein CopC
MRLPRRIIAALLFGATSVVSAAAAAHAIIVESTPAVDAVVAGPDVPVMLRFNSRIDQERSRLTLTGPDGKAKNLAMSAAAAPDLLKAVASGLAPGAYKLRWQVLAVDGHITRGDIPFHVGP